MENAESQCPVQIATTSVAEGLDFACNILAGRVGRCIEVRVDLAPGVLNSLSQYIRFRYAGEDHLALKELAAMGRDVQLLAGGDWAQFWRQLEWVARQIEVTLEACDFPTG